MAQQFQLPDGRNLDYSVYGPPDGFPLVMIHGTPAAFPAVPPLLSSCEKKGVKLITFSRAGYGGSTRNKGRRVIDIVADLQALNEHLGIKQCIVGGWSGGGPHALACAARLPGCVAVLCVASAGPYGEEGLDFLAGQGEENIEEFKAALKGEPELQKFCAAQRAGILNADVSGLIEAWSTILPAIDKETLIGNKGLGQYLLDVLKEGLKISCDGWVDDDLAFLKPWGFNLSEIKVPVTIYHGSEDKMAPYAHGVWIAEHLPQEKLKKHLISGQGHISIFIGQTDSIVDELLEMTKL